MYDLVIIGNGPAGLSAAVYAKRAMLDMVMVGKKAFAGGQIMNTEQIDNYLGLYGMKGHEMAMAFRKHADALEVPWQDAAATAVADKKDFRIVTLENGETLETRAVLIATGAKHRHLGVAGEKELTGLGVSYCATCDGAFYQGKDVVVVGGGDVALGDALYLAKGCRKVYLVHRRDAFRAAKVLRERVEQTDNIEFYPFCEVTAIHGDGAVEAVSLIQSRTKEEYTIPVSGIFVAIGMEPETAFVADAVETDKAGYIVADEMGITATEGIFAAGDVRTKALRQIATAVSDGANAIASIEAYLE